jgi:cell division inhibitor SulA/protein ImuA
MNTPLTLEQLARLCRDAEGSRGPRPAAAPSGFAELDARLPGGGWPVGAIAELISDAPGIGELSLIVPVLSRLARAGRHIAWIAPPYLPYAPALAQRGLPLERVLLVQTHSLQESLWAMEQALRCPAVGAVLGWPASIVDRNVRRLQLAAAAGGSLGILYRPPEAARESSPAALRLRLHAAPEGLAVEIHKSRGGNAGLTLQLAVASTAAASTAATSTVVA